MTERISEPRKILLESLDNLGYEFHVATHVAFLKNVLPTYILSKLEGKITDFVLIPKEDTGGSENNLYSIYIKEKDNERK